MLPKRRVKEDNTHEHTQEEDDQSDFENNFKHGCQLDGFSENKQSWRELVPENVIPDTAKDTVKHDVKTSSDYRNFLKPARRGHHKLVSNRENIRLSVVGQNDGKP